jgi:flagellum-specific peptidoglycan hydrolase FlgJ
MINIDQQIYDAALKGGFTPTSAKLIVAQARHETGDYKSNVFNKNNNLFGMKFVGQPLATRGTPAPKSEWGCGGKCNSDFYSKYANISDSVQDLINRNLKFTRNGVTFEQLKNAPDSTTYANLLKKRGYYGATASLYDSGLKRALSKLNIVEMAKELVKSKKGQFIIGLTLVGVGLLIYYKIFKLKTY